MAAADSAGKVVRCFYLVLEGEAKEK